MKNLMFTFGLLIVLNSVNSQSIKNDFIFPDDGKSYTNIYINTNELMVSNTNSDNLDTLYSSKHKDYNKGFKHFAFMINYDRILYDRNRKSFIGDFINVSVEDGSLIVLMSEENCNKLKVLTFYNSDGTASVIITEIKPNGRTKTYFSRKCELKKRCF
jgi:hypothetical protein